MKVALFLVLGLGAVGAASYFLPDRFGRTEAAESMEDAVFLARSGDLEIRITENGYLKSKNSIELQPKFRGQSVITWLVDEGTSVEEGDVLVKFDDTDLQQKLEDTENRLIQYKTELEAAKADLEIASRENEATIEKAELSLEISRLTLERYNDGEHPNTLRKNDLAVEKAESEHKRAKKRHEEAIQLLSEDFVTETQVEEESIRMREAAINWENSRKDRELYNDYTHRMELRQKESDVRNNERSLETARQRAEINTKEKQARVTNRSSQVSSTEASLEKTKKDLEAMEIKAPSPGLVLYGDPTRPWQRDNVKIGNSMYQGRTVITLPDLSEMQVLIHIHEADIDQVELEQETVITLDTYPGQTFTGKVTHIASVADSVGWSDDSNRQFRVEVTMDPMDIEVRAGITAKVEILIDVLEDVLHVPIHAVYQEGEEYFCFVPEEQGGFSRRTVSIGRHNTHYVAIEEGLEEGAKVLLYDPREQGKAEGASSSNGADDSGDDADSVPTTLSGDSAE